MSYVRTVRSRSAVVLGRARPLLGRAGAPQSPFERRRRNTRVLSSLLLSSLRERYPNRGLVISEASGPCAAFPGIHPGIRGVSVYDDGDELTVVVDDLTHGHFAVYEDNVPEAERGERIVGEVVEFLDDLFSDRMVVWGIADVGGGWYRRVEDRSYVHAGATEYLWSGPLGETQTEPEARVELQQE